MQVWRTLWAVRYRYNDKLLLGQGCDFGKPNNVQPFQYHHRSISTLYIEHYLMHCESKKAVHWTFSPKSHPCSNKSLLLKPYGTAHSVHHTRKSEWSIHAIAAGGEMKREMKRIRGEMKISAWIDHSGSIYWCMLIRNSESTNLIILKL